METQSFNSMCAESKIHDLEEEQPYAIQAKRANSEFPKQLNDKRGLEHRRHAASYCEPCLE